MSQLALAAKLPDLLARELAEQIVSGKWPAGWELPSEAELADRYNVSKPVLRSASQQLALSGLVRVRHGKRTTVLPEHDWDVLNDVVQRAFDSVGRLDELLVDLYDVRLGIEPVAAGLCATHVHDDGLVNLRALADRMSALKSNPNSLPEFLELDREFHAMIAQWSGNLVLAATMRALHNIVARSWTSTTVVADELDALVAQHLAIAHAIFARDSDAATQAMRKHLEWARLRERSRSRPRGQHAITLGMK